MKIYLKIIFPLSFIILPKFSKVMTSRLYLCMIEEIVSLRWGYFFIDRTYRELKVILFLKYILDMVTMISTVWFKNKRFKIVWMGWKIYFMILMKYDNDMSIFSLLPSPSRRGVGGEVLRLYFSASFCFKKLWISQRIAIKIYELYLVDIYQTWKIHHRCIHLSSR